MVIAIAVLIYLDAQVRYRFRERIEQMPARVYARPLQLSAHTRLTASDLAFELGLLGYRSSGDTRQPGSYQRYGEQFDIHTRGRNIGGQKQQPLRFKIAFSGDRVRNLQSISGKALDHVLLDPIEIGSIYPRHREDRVLAKLEDVPRSLVETLILIEDRHFYTHWGISPRAIARAFMANIKAGRTVQGGSTITQQLVKNVFLDNSRNLVRKGTEALMAPMVELHYSKDQILEAYLNEVYLGQEGPRSIHGFALASRHYFNRPLAELNPGQIAMLVGMVKGPSYYDPWRNPDNCRERRNLVLQVMADQLLISQAQADQWKKAGLDLAKSNAMEGVYPAYLDLVRRQLGRDYSDTELQTKGMQIFTSFDPILQRTAERSLAEVLKGQDKAIEGAMIVTAVGSGDVVAVVGGRRMRFAGFNRAVDAVRPTGSLMKPVVYLAALENPQQYTLATVISDNPVEVAGRDGSVWQPQNFDHTSHGEVMLHKALAQSYNQAAARLGMEVGLKPVTKLAQRMGVARPIPLLPSVLLGAAEMSLLDVTALYQTIAAHGMNAPLRTITNITGPDGHLLARYPQHGEQVVDQRAMHLLHYSMMEVVREGTGRAVYQRLPPDYRVAGKTGTTDDLRDSWFAGFAGDYLAVVWLGRDDNKSAGLTGSTGALKVWSQFMARASHVPLSIEPPEGIVYLWIDENTGLRSKSICAGARYMPFIQGSAPEQSASCNTNLPSIWQWFRNIF